MKMERIDSNELTQAIREELRDLFGGTRDHL